MKRNYLLLIFLLIIFLCSNAFSQQEVTSFSKETNGISISVTFKNEIPFQKIVDGKTILDFTYSKDESKPGSPILPSKNYYIAIPPESKINIELINKKIYAHKNVEPAVNSLVKQINDSTLSYELINFNRNYFVSDFYPSNEVEILGYIWIRDYYCAIVKINTHRFDWKRKEILEMISTDLKINFSNLKQFAINTTSESIFDKSLSKIILNYEQAKEYRTFRKISVQDTTQNWIDYTKDYIKLGIAEKDGIYRIDYNDLQSYSVPISSINPKTFKIFLKGEQIPIYVNGEEDFSFDENDFIEFWATKNYGSPNYRNIVPLGTDYLNYMDRYNDTTFVWLSWDGDDGIRTINQNINPDGITDTISSHLVKLHFETDSRLWYYDAVAPRVQLPFWQENKVWTWLTIGGSGSTQINFQAKNIVPDSQLKTYVRLISYASDAQTNAHKTGVSVNSTSPQDSITYNFKQTANLFSTFSSNQLIEVNNILRIFGMKAQSGFVNQSLIDWAEVEYFRFNNAINDSIYIKIPDTLTTAIRIIKINNLTSVDSNLFVYKVKSQTKKIVNFNLSGTTNKTLTFADTVSGGDEYFIIKKDLIKKPIFKTKKQFVNLRNNPNGADYIIISNKELIPSVNEYNDFISSNYQLRTKLIFIDDIYDEFAYGFNKPESIRDFLIYVWNNWSKPEPSYLVLIGDANYDYKDIWSPVPTPRRKNLVPSYGFPVSDVWYVTFDSTNYEIPQMFVGRIPANSNDEINFYLNKHQTYLNRNFDEWNKTFLFFSGGDVNKPSEMAQIKTVNDSLFYQYVKPIPISGSGMHFYKTINPPSNFGPYSHEEINNAIGNGGLFISYIGHSGTQTWDNGIISVNDLKNNYDNRFPLISDFGCSTGKFAEPDVNAFGEIFISGSVEGQAINYLGNSSWGYLSTSLRFPLYFYSNYLKDTIREVGQSHLLGKIKQFQQTGYSDVNRVFNYCNLLFGDPIVSLQLPKKPNFNISQSSFKLLEEAPNDQMDSVQIQISIRNLGIVKFDSLQISIADSYNDSIIFQKEIYVFPIFFTTGLENSIVVNIPIRNLTGQHNLSVILDEQNKIEEIYENDNSNSFNFNVVSNSLRWIETDKYYTTFHNEIQLLNPQTVSDNSINGIKLSIADNPNFNSALEIEKEFDTLVTKIQLNNLEENKRYWFRAKFNSSSSQWSEVFSFNNINSDFNWLIDSTCKINDVSSKEIIFDSVKKGLELGLKINHLKIISGGFYAGEVGSMQLNNVEQLPNTYFWGVASALIDSITLEPYSIKYYLYPPPASADSLISFINSLSNGTIVALTICTDAAQSVIGYNGGTPVRNAIKTLGSYYIDSVKYRESWCILGKKGAPIGSVSESYKKLFEGPASIDTSVVVKYDSGSVRFPIISNSSEWNKVKISSTLPEGSNLEFIPLGIKANNEIDSLNNLVFVDDSASIQNIDANVYPQIQLIGKFKNNSLGESPLLKSIAVNFKSLPELAINYQTVLEIPDTIYQNDNIDFYFDIMNVGKIKADSFRVKLDFKRFDNLTRNLFDTLITSLDVFEKKSFNLLYKYSQVDSIGNSAFQIIIDVDNKVREFYKDNNIYEIPFYIKKDSNVSVETKNIAIEFDGENIMDGDYVSPNPNILIIFQYSDQIQFDSTDAEFRLDNKKIFYSQLDIVFSNSDKTATFNYKPQLTDGLHSLKVFLKNENGLMNTFPSYEVQFNVSNQLQILNAMNYPNPFSDETYFTFLLTQIPEEVKIRIFTVAGRLIKEIKLNDKMKVNFNTIFWDGRDEDGNLVANGVYLYKIIVKKENKTETITQKLAVVR